MHQVFNDSPASLRGRRHQADRLAADGGLALRLPVAPGYDWAAVRSFLAARAIPGVEVLDGDTYRRTITVAGSPGLLEVSPGDTAGPAGGYLLLRAHLPYWEGLIHIVERVARVLGSDADHAADIAAVRADPVLGALAATSPGSPVPGAWDPFEAGVSTILSGRPGREQRLRKFVAQLGTPVHGLPIGLTSTFPDVMTVTPAALARAGLPDADAAAIARLAGTLSAGGAVRIDPGHWLPRHRRPLAASGISG
jgi:AraC family transcriptional regulator, regulatory protein of adaptative response / DNA-3-methyladenine glycosylase II